MRKRNFGKRNNHRTSVVKTRIEVTDEECHGNAEKMVRRFIKKVKREGIIDEIRDRRYYKKPKEVRAEKKRKRKRTIEKINNDRDKLFITTNQFKRRR
tara:strand:+ start:148 stop:441 length:294 start_codon:yes stop_codon:yes gene_type:complete